MTKSEDENRFARNSVSQQYCRPCVIGFVLSKSDKATRRNLFDMRRNSKSEASKRREMKQQLFMVVDSTKCRLVIRCWKKGFYFFFVALAPRMGIIFSPSLNCWFSNVGMYSLTFCMSSGFLPFHYRNPVKKRNKRLF